MKRDTELSKWNLICQSIKRIFTRTVQAEVVFEPDKMQGDYPLSYPVTIPPEPKWTHRKG